MEKAPVRDSSELLALLLLLLLSTAELVVLKPPVRDPSEVVPGMPVASVAREVGDELGPP